MKRTTTTTTAETHSQQHITHGSAAWHSSKYGNGKQVEKQVDLARTRNKQVKPGISQGRGYGSLSALHQVARNLRILNPRSHQAATANTHLGPQITPQVTCHRGELDALSRESTYRPGQNRFNHRAPLAPSNAGKRSEPPASPERGDTGKVEYLISQISTSNQLTTTTSSVHLSNSNRRRKNDHSRYRQTISLR